MQTGKFEVFPHTPKKNIFTDLKCKNRQIWNECVDLNFVRWTEAVGEITIQPVRNYINNPLDKWFSVELTSAFYFTAHTVRCWKGIDNEI